MTITLTCPACGKQNTSPTIQFRTTGVEGQSHGGLCYVCTCSAVIAPYQEDESEPPQPTRIQLKRPKPQQASRSHPAQRQLQFSDEFEALASLASAPQDGDVLTNAKQRVKVLNKALKLTERLRQERDSLQRLLDAAKKPQRNARAATVAADRMRRPLPS